MTDYEISQVIFKGLHLNLTGQELVNFVVAKTGCTPEAFRELYEDIVAAWAQ